MHGLPWITIFRLRVRRFACDFHEWRSLRHEWHKNRYSRQQIYYLFLTRYIMSSTYNSAKNNYRSLISPLPLRTAVNIDFSPPGFHGSSCKKIFLSMVPWIQYIPRNMHTVFALLCFVVVIHWLIFPYPSGLLHWHCGNLTITPVPAKQPWWI